MRSFDFLCKQCPAIAAVVAASVVALWSVPTLAAGFFLPTQGVEPTARGGASIAPHDGTLNSLWYNPAGLALLEHQTLHVDLGLIGRYTEFHRAPRRMDDGSLRHYEPVQNEAPPNTIPQILVGGPIPRTDFAWSAGVYTHYAASDRYPVDGAQRYTLIDNIGSALGYAHLAVAWDVHERLMLGAGFQNFMGSFRIVAKSSGYTGMYGDPEDEELDVLSVAEVTSLFNPTGNMGALVSITDRVDVGASLQLPHLFHDPEATIESRRPEHPTYDTVEQRGDTADVQLPFPFYLRGGVRYVGDRFDVELAGVYQHWSAVDEIVVDPDIEMTGVPGMGTVPVQPTVIPQDFRNTFSAHLGGRWSVDESIDVRGGYVFERSAIPDHRYSVLHIDPNKHQFSVGGGYEFDSLTVDATAAAIVMPTRVITDSEVRQINASDTEDDHAIVVGNGRYSHFGYIAGLGLSYRF